MNALDMHLFKKVSQPTQKISFVLKQAAVVEMKIQKKRIRYGRCGAHKYFPRNVCGQWRSVSF